MRNMIGVHLIPAHWGEFWGRHDADWLRDWQPRFVKVVCDDETVPHVTELPPAAQIIVRNYPLSEQGHSRGFKAKSLSLEAAADMGLPQTGSARDLLRAGPGAFADAEALLGVVTRGTNDLPETVGIAHAQAHARAAAWCAARGIAPARLLFEGLNEPLLWSNEPPELVARYEAARLREAHRLGLRCVIGNFGVGWPGNGGVQDAPVGWDFFKPAIAAMLPGDYLGLHEYWALNGPRENWKWWGGRFLQCPYRVPILITETGVDTGVTGRWYGGWGDIPANTWDERARRYVDELFWYAQQGLTDGRVQCVFPFTYDIGSREWEKFDVRNQVFLGELLRRPADAVIPAPIVPSLPPVAPPPVTPPVTPPPAPTDAAWVAVKAAGAVDARAQLETKGSYARRELAAVKRIVVHHSAVKPSVSWAAVARYHVRSNGWPGIGYHFGIMPDGGLTYTGAVETVRYHAGNANGDSVGVCFAGDFRTDEPTPAALATFRKLIGALEGALGRQLAVIGHRDVGQTVCPGDKLYAAAVGEDAPDITAELLRLAAPHDLTRRNPATALYRAIVAAGAVPCSEEFRVAVDGQEYACQWGGEPGEPAKLYWCVVGKWAEVYVI